MKDHIIFDCSLTVFINGVMKAGCIHAYVIG